MRQPEERLSLQHNWPICEQGGRFDLGHILSSAVIDACDAPKVGELSLSHAGCWECDLDDDRLTWSAGVYDLFGLPRGAKIARHETLSFYTPASLSLLERLRTHAIERNCGFTFDAEIRPAVGGARRMRIIAAALVNKGIVKRLHGLKLLV